MGMLDENENMQIFKRCLMLGLKVFIPSNSKNVHNKRVSCVVAKAMHFKF